jgi:hypothetical protein
MKLIEVDKARYKKHLNIVIVGFISSLLILSLLFGSVLIALFSDLNHVSDVGNVAEMAEAAVTASEVEATQDSNFRYNLLGVLLALLANAAVLHSVKHSEFFTEVYYVWQIKQTQNLIYRKLRKIKIAAKDNENQALLILFYYYQSIKQLYVLDDNTITLSTVEQNLQDVTDTITEKGLDVEATPFDKKMLANY